jgi:Divergent InlB B-repeat domain/Lamin Tail Domain
LVFAPPASAGEIQINEFQTAGAGGASDEWVDLYNPNSSCVDITGYKLVYRTAAGTSDVLLAAMPNPSGLSAGGFLLIAGPAYGGSADITYPTGTLSSTAGGIGLRQADGTLINSVGYGSGVTDGFVEGSAASVPGSGQSDRRTPDGTDTENNASDFTLATTPTPRHGGLNSGCPGTLHALTVSVNGTGMGTVTGSGINCPGTCSHNYDNGTSVTLGATPANNSSFAGWSGACSGTGVCNLTMNSDQSVTASFTQNAPHNLTVTKSGSGSGTVTSSPPGINCGSTCSEPLPDGTQVTLSASPNPGSTFAGWSGGGCSGTSTCTVTMSSAQTVTATFVNHLALTVRKAGAGSGTVTSGPAGINCGPACSASYDGGTAIRLTATPAAGETFSGWSGGGCSGTSSCTVTMNSPQTVTATFALPSFPGVSIRGGTLRVKNGVVTVSLTSPLAATGKLTLTSVINTKTGKVITARARRITLGKASFSLTAGTTKKLRIHLSRQACRLLAKDKSMKALETAVATDQFATKTTTHHKVTLKLAKH